MDTEAAGRGADVDALLKDMDSKGGAAREADATAGPAPTGGGSTAVRVMPVAADEQDSKTSTAMEPTGSDESREHLPGTADAVADTIVEASRRLSASGRTPVPSRTSGGAARRRSGARRVGGTSSLSGSHAGSRAGTPPSGAERGAVRGRGSGKGSSDGGSSPKAGRLSSASPKSGVRRLSGTRNQGLTRVRTSEQLMNRRQATLRDLDASVEQSFTQMNLRKLFRVFDVDNNKVLRHDEFQSGLLGLGYAAAADPVVASKFLMEVDSDRTGYISEDEFVAYFQKVKKDDIQRKLNVLKSRSTLSVKVTEFGPFEEEFKTFELASESELVDFLMEERRNGEFSDKKMRSRKRWYDVRGYDSSAMEVLAAVLDIHPETIKDAAIFQQPKIETIHSGAVDAIDTEDMSSMRAQILVHALTLVNDPLVEGESVAASTGMVSTNKNTQTLVPAKVLAENPPDLAFEQVSIICVDDNTVLSIRSSETNDAEHPVFPVFERMHRDVADFTTLSSVHTGSSRFLAFELTDAILQHNYEIRDVLKDWQTALEVDIRASARPYQTPHLYALQRLADSFSRHLMPLKDELTIENWREDPSSVFFGEQDILFRELYDDLVTITSDVASTIEMSEKLNQLYQRLQADRMNRVLYVLTVVTAVFIPAQFLTGLWGMNFEGMPELKWEHGYLMFWLLVIVAVGTVLGLFRIFKVF